MRNNPYLLILFSFCLLLLFSCLERDFALIVPEEFCDNGFIDCGPGSHTEFVHMMGLEWCQCSCDENYKMKFLGFSNSVLPLTTCVCKETSCENDFERRVYDANCECILIFLDDDYQTTGDQKNLIAESDFFPLNPNQSFIYDLLNEQGVPNGRFGYMTLDTTLVYLLHDSLQLAIPTILFHQAFLVYDSNGVLNDTILGPSFHNQPEDPNLVMMRTANGNSLIGVHQPAFGDSIGNAQDGYIYFDQIGSVEVPAGTFNDCLLISNDHLNGYVFAPDVGLIKVTANGMDAMVLTEFNGNSDSEDCEEILNVSDPITDNSVYKASDHITIASEIQGSYELTLQAANYIQLNPGFCAPLGAVVTAIIAVCENL